MTFEARIEPVDGRLPKVSYHWDAETDILSVACKGAGKTSGLNGTVDLEGSDGSFVVIDVAGGSLRGVDVVTWPDDIRTRDDLVIPEAVKEGRGRFPNPPAPPGIPAGEGGTGPPGGENQRRSAVPIPVGRATPAARGRGAGPAAAGGGKRPP